MQTSYLIFTDLDGTLLDHDTYDYKDALEAVDYIKDRKIPLIICSSKTRPEIELYQKELGLKEPFIVENGGAIFIPQGTIDLQDIASISRDDYAIIELGVPYQKIKAYFAEIKSETGLKMAGFSEMSLTKIADITGLSRPAAQLALRRDYSEPFLFEEENQLAVLEGAAQRRGLKITRGGRFYHLIGHQDKGQAVRILKKLYKPPGQSLVSIGLGDSINDFPMLENVDIPILVKKKTGRYESWPGPKEIFLAPGVGPKGWNKAVLNILKGGDS